MDAISKNQNTDYFHFSNQDYLDKTNELEQMCKGNKVSGDLNKLLSGLNIFTEDAWHKIALHPTHPQPVDFRFLLHV